MARIARVCAAAETKKVARNTATWGRSLAKILAKSCRKWTALAAKKVAVRAMGESGVKIKKLHPYANVIL